VGEVTLGRKGRFGLKPHCLVADSSYGSVGKKIAPHIRVFDKSTRTDASRADFVSDMSRIATSIRPTPNCCSSIAA